MLMRERIQYTRRLYGLNQTEVATEMGVSRNYIGQIESGYKSATDEQLEDILNAVYKTGEKKKKDKLKEVKDDLNKQNL